MVKIYFGSINHLKIEQLRAHGSTIYGSTAKPIQGTELLPILTPTWSMVAGYKNYEAQIRYPGYKPLSEEEYTEKYHQILEKNIHAIDEWIYELLESDKEIAICCYCRTGSFCHTTLAYNYLSARYAADLARNNNFEMELLGATSLSTSQPIVTTTLQKEETTMNNTTPTSILKTAQVEWLSTDHSNFSYKLGRLANIPKADRPTSLHYQGDITLLQSPIVAIIGARKCSERDAQAAEAIGYFLASQGYTIATGNAAGIDQAAQRGALRAGGKVIAVLPHGFETTSYHTGRNDAEQILAGGGLLIGEYQYGLANYEQFLQRNRLVVGMSLAVIPVCGNVRDTRYGGNPHESAGTYQATEKASRYNTPVFVPYPPNGSEDNPLYSLNRLLHQIGAPYFSKATYNGQRQENYTLLLAELEKLKKKVFHLDHNDEAIQAIDTFVSFVKEIREAYPTYTQDELINEISSILNQPRSKIEHIINLLLSY